MGTKLAPQEMSSLGYYIKENLFENWKKDRSDIDTEMQTNLDAFNAVVTGDFWKEGEAEGWRSETFVQITKMKVLAAYSMVIDILLQGGKIPFTLKPSPWDIMVFDDLPPEQKQEIEDNIADMKKLIRQQLMDCNGDRQLMMNVMAGAIYGETYGKYFVHEVERTGFDKVNLVEGFEDPEFVRWEPFRAMTNSPAFEYLSNWSLYRDLETNDLQAGVGVIQRDMISPYDLRQKVGGPFWLTEPINRAISEADIPTGIHGTTTIAVDTSKLPPGLRNIQHRHKTMEAVEFWGRAPRVVVEQFEKDIQQKNQSETQPYISYDWLDYENDGDEIEIMVVMADDEIVRYSRNKPKSRPFYRVVWEINLDETCGTGIPKNLRSVQKVINGAVRAFEDNKKLSANIIAAVKRQFMPGWDGKFKPGTEIELSDECDDARKAIQQVIIQDVGETLLSLIGIFERYADETSQLPKILQGAVHAKEKPDTLGEMNMLQANAGKYLGGVIKNYDEGIIEPVTSDFYKFNMADPDLKKGKGNYIAHPLGFTSFQNQVVRLQKLMQGLNLTLSSEILVNETKIPTLLEEIWKAFDIDPDHIMKSSDEKTAEAKQNAEMRAEVEAKTLQVMNQNFAREEEIKRSDHLREMEKITAKIEGEVKKIEEKFENDLILKKTGEKPKVAEKVAEAV